MNEFEIKRLFTDLEFFLDSTKKNLEKLKDKSVSIDNMRQLIKEVVVYKEKLFREVFQDEKYSSCIVSEEYIPERYDYKECFDKKEEQKRDKHFQRMMGALGSEVEIDSFRYE